jgi:hypothetical protein
MTSPVTGDTSPEPALRTLRQMAAANEPVALLLVNEAALDFLARAHELHPRAKRVLLVDRDYSSTSPAVQAITPRTRRLSHRPALDERRDDVPRDERVPLRMNARAGAELRAVSDHHGGG